MNKSSVWKHSKNLQMFSLFRLSILFCIDL